MKPIEILTKHNLKRTSCREGIIKIIMAEKNALSESEIRKKLEGNYDRTTFYRSFRTLEESNIIHKIVVNNQMVKYALDSQSVANNTKHAHFHCNNCNAVKCLESVPIIKYTLPEGYDEIETRVLIQGTCAKCKKKQVSA